MKRISAIIGVLLVLSMVAADRPDDATLRVLLRRAVGEVTAIKDEKLAGQRCTTLDTLAEAQEKVGDTAGARLSRTASDKILASNSTDTARDREWRLFQSVYRSKPVEAERAYEEFVRQAVAAKKPHGPGALFGASEVVTAGTRLADRLNTAQLPDAARRVLVLARSASQALNDYYGRVYVAREQIKMGDVEAARETLDGLQKTIDGMTKVGSRLSGLGIMIAARENLGDKEIARSLYKQADELARSQPEEMSSRLNAMNQLPAMLVSIGDSEAALRMVVEEAESRQAAAVFPAGPQPDVGLFVRRQNETSQAAAVFSTVVDAIGQSARVATDNHHALVYPRMDEETAKQALRSAAMLAEASRIEQIRASLAGIIIFQVRLGDLEGARESYQKFQREPDPKNANSSKVRILIEVARAERKAGDRPAAEVDFDAAFHAANALAEVAEEQFGRRNRTIHPRDKALGLIVIARAELDDVEAAIAVASRIHDPVEKGNALVTAARMRLSEPIANSWEDRHYIPIASRVVTQALTPVEKGDTAASAERKRLSDNRAAALRLLKAPGHGFGALSMLTEIAEREQRIGDPAAAEPILQFALKEAENYALHHPHDPTIPALNPNGITTHWDVEPEGREREIRQETAASLELARIRPMLGDIPGAFRALESISKPEWREAPVPGILARQLEFGDAKGAFAAAFRMSDPSQRLGAIYVLGDAIKRLNKPSPQP